jgi:hypothetical protein
MAGYSGTPLGKKLGIREAAVVVLAGAPAGFEDALAPLPDAVTVTRRNRPGADVAILFAPSASVLRRRFAPLAATLDRAGGLWVCWPKRSSGVATDLDENVVRAHGLAAGLVDNKVCAVDDTWSGLRFVYRLADR